MISIVDSIISKINNSNNNLIIWFIAFLFLILCLVDQSGLIEIDYYESYLEHIQILVIIFIFSITFIYRKIFKKCYGKYVYFIRLVAVGFVFYEEISFLSSKICKFCNSFNIQGEFNIHNIQFFWRTVLVKLPLIDELYLMTAIICSLVLFLSWGKYLPFVGNIKGIFLERRFRLNGSLFIIERIFSHIISSFSFLPIFSGRFPYLIHPEFLELHLYILILFDLLIKIEIAKKEESGFT